MNGDIRKPTDAEMAIFKKLLSGLSDSRSILEKQIDKCCVTICDEYGSLNVFVRNDVEKTNVDGPVVTGMQKDKETQDGYGPYINFILFVKDGLINELQIYKDDGSKISIELNPENFIVVPRE